MKRYNLMLCGCLLLSGCASVIPQNNIRGQQEGKVLTLETEEACYGRDGTYVVVMMAPDEEEPISSVTRTGYFSRLTLIEKGLLDENTPVDDFRNILLENEKLEVAPERITFEKQGDTISLSWTLTPEEIDALAEKIYSNAYFDEVPEENEKLKYANLKEIYRRLEYDSGCALQESSKPETTDQTNTEDTENGESKAETETESENTGNDFEITPIKPVNPDDFDFDFDTD